MPSNSPTIVEQTIITPGSFSLSADICNSLSEEQKIIFASASLTALQELACNNQANCSADILSVCGKSYVIRNRLLSPYDARKLQQSSVWQINYQVTQIFTCQTVSFDSAGDKFTASSIVSTISDSVTSAFSNGR